jgi:hypothetical protein
MVAALISLLNKSGCIDPTAVRHFFIEQFAGKTQGGATCLVLSGSYVKVLFFHRQEKPAFPHPESLRTNFKKATPLWDALYTNDSTTY